MEPFSMYCKITDIVLEQELETEDEVDFEEE